MGWKDYSYWLKGAIIFSLLHTLALVVTITVSSSANSSVGAAFSFFFLGLIDYPLIIVAQLILPSISFFNSTIGASVMFFIFGTIEWFILGTLIGWIYGKTMNKVRL